MLASLLLAVQCSADPVSVINEATGFWLGDHFTTKDAKKQKRGRSDGLESSDFSSSIIDLTIIKKETHWIVSGVARVFVRTSKTYIFLGSRELKHDHRIVPIAMPDVENRFSFYVNGALVVHLTEAGKVASSGGYSFPRFLYVGALGQPIKRIDLEKINSKQQSEQDVAPIHE